MPMLGIAAVRVNDLSTDGAFAGAGGQVRVGQMVLPWLGLGLQIGGDYGVRSESGARQQLALGNLLVDLQFVPLHKRRLGWTLRAGFGVGGGAVHQAGVEGRAGFGGAVFSAATGYSFFPVADRRRPDRGGGFAIGPEVGWIGATPASKGGPTAHMFYLAATLLFYFGS
jgi:hypothetical protein